MYGDPPPRRPRDPPSSAPSISSKSSNRRKPGDQLRNITTKKMPSNAPYLLDGSNNDRTLPINQSSSHYFHPRNHNPGTAYRGSMDRDRPTLRKRGSSTDSSSKCSHYRHDRNSNGNARKDLNSQRIHHSTTQTVSTNCLSRKITVAVLCVLMCWGSFWGIEIGIGLVRVTFKYIFGFGGRHQKSSHDNQLGESHSILGSDETIQGLRGFNVEFSDARNMPNQRESEGSEGLSIHDLNAKSHMLKAEGRQIINDRPMENDEYGKGDKSYMGQDSTNDFFYAGGLSEVKRTVNMQGRIETISHPAHSYAVLPAMDHNPFVISIWVFLSPLTKNKEKDGILDEKYVPRVILSTRSTDRRGCHSDTFGLGGAPTAGFVLYAQPHYGDIAQGDEGAIAYHIVLEYGIRGIDICRTLTGTNENGLLIREGQWHHVTLFATQLLGEGEERISLYVNGDLAGRNAQERRVSTFKKIQ